MGHVLLGTEQFLEIQPVVGDRLSGVVRTVQVDLVFGDTNLFGSQEQVLGRAIRSSLRLLEENVGCAL